MPPQKLPYVRSFFCFLPLLLPLLPVGSSFAGRESPLSAVLCCSTFISPQKTSHEHELIGRHGKTTTRFNGREVKLKSKTNVTKQGTEGNGLLLTEQSRAGAGAEKISSAWVGLGLPTRTGSTQSKVPPETTHRP